MKIIRIFILPFLFLLVGCALEIQRPDGDAIDIGQGETVFRFEAITDDGATAWNVFTNEETLGAALSEAGLIAGDEGALGLFVTSVNGLEAPDGTWWMLLIDDDPAMKGVNDIIIEAERVYAFVLTRF